MTKPRSMAHDWTLGYKNFIPKRRWWTVWCSLSSYSSQFWRKTCLIWLLHLVRQVFLQATDLKLVPTILNNSLLHRQRPKLLNQWRRRETSQATQVWIPRHLLIKLCNLFVNLCLIFIFLIWVPIISWFWIRPGSRSNSFVSQDSHGNEQIYLWDL